MERMALGVRTPKKLAFATGLILFVIIPLITGCANADPGNTASPAGPVARIEVDLYNLIFWMAIGVFIVVGGLLLWTVVRYRRRRADYMPAQTHGSTPLEITWTIIPFIILAIIAVPTLSSIASATEVPTGPNVVRVKVIGHQWWWEFQYPDLNVITSDELHIPVGSKIALDIGSADVIHSFWVPRLGGKIQAIPNQQDTTWIQADELGTYTAQCYQLCGTSHANMRFIVVSESKADFDTWVKGQSTPAVVAAGAEKGAQIFASSACVGCHTITGTAAAGKVGPNLTHIGSHRTIAGAIMLNDPEHLAMWLHDPPGMKPGSIMPNLGLTDDQVSSLVTYLDSLK